MPVETTRAVIKGMEFIGSLRNPDFVKPVITRPSGNRQMLVYDEQGDAVVCSSFVAFSEKTMNAFPGSYITPHMFQHTLENKSVGEWKDVQMLGNYRGTMEKPAYEYIDANGRFGVTILNGATTDGAIQLARIAHEGFTSANRALYQQTVANLIEPALVDTSKLTAPIRIHDDCLASTISVMGYIAELHERNPDLLKDGIDILIDGPATAQGVLFLQKFSQTHNIKLTITASYLAFGLTEGEVVPEKKTRAHANYITIPQELFTTLPPATQMKYREFAPADGDRAVVGDMGTASKGIPFEEMTQIRTAVSDPELCIWNEARTDPHHPENGDEAKVQIDLWDNVKPRTNIYFPRGGYISYAYDKTYNPNQFFEANTRMVGATRLWSEQLGYGVAYGVQK